jgi:hypothetical protein
MLTVLTRDQRAGVVTQRLESMAKDASGSYREVATLRETGQHREDLVKRKDN